MFFSPKSILRKRVKILLSSVACSSFFLFSVDQQTAEASKLPYSGYGCFMNSGKPGAEDLEVSFDAVETPDDAWGVNYFVKVRSPSGIGFYIEEFEGVGQLGYNFSGGKLKLGQWTTGGDEGEPILVEDFGSLEMLDVSKGFPDPEIRNFGKLVLTHSKSPLKGEYTLVDCSGDSF
jgi:hypothetical protein